MVEKGQSSNDKIKEMIWLAGLIEDEGSFHIIETHQVVKGHSYHYVLPQFALKMTDKACMDRAEKS